MWTKEELKYRGKASMKSNYWNSVLAGFLMSLSGGGLLNAGRHSFGQIDEYESITQEQAAILIGAAVAGLTIMMFTSIVKILALNPLLVGCRHFFRRNLYMRPDAGEVGWGFKNGYGRNILTLFLTDLFLLFWTILFLIPGLIKSYSYRMVPYILEDFPDASPTEVITMSREMMDGHKMNAFFLDLSFIGWFLLTLVTLGLAGVFYVNPYKAGTDAALYEAIKSEKY